VGATGHTYLTFESALGPWVSNSLDVNFVINVLLVTSP